MPRPSASRWCRKSSIIRSSGQVLHVDFHEVAENEKVTIMVPVETTGEAAGVKTGGGVLEHVLFKLKVRALPKDLPEQLIIDVPPWKSAKPFTSAKSKRRKAWKLSVTRHIPVVSVAAPRTEAKKPPRPKRAAGCWRSRDDQGEEGRRRRRSCAGRKRRQGRGERPPRRLPPRRRKSRREGAATRRRKPAEKKK